MTEEELRQRIYDNMETVRKARGITKTALAQAMGVNRSYIYAMNRCTTMPTIRFLDKYCRAVGCSMSDIVNGTVSPEDYRLPDGIEGIWPYNLALAIRGNGKDRNFIEHVYAPGLLSALDELTEREQKIINLRFRSLMTLEAVSKVFGVTRERVRQVEAKALRELAKPKYFNRWYTVPKRELLDVADERDKARLECIKLKQRLESIITRYGIPENADAINEEVGETDLDLEVMELSVRSFNGLKRAGVDTIGQLRGMTKTKLRNIRCLGVKSFNEIVKRASDFGIEIAD